MTKREARRFVRRCTAREIRERIAAEMPIYADEMLAQMGVSNEQVALAVEVVWRDEALKCADRIDGSVP